MDSIVLIYFDVPYEEAAPGPPLKKLFLKISQN